MNFAPLNNYSKINLKFVMAAKKHFSEKRIVLSKTRCSEKKTKRFLSQRVTFLPAAAVMTVFNIFLDWAQSHLLDQFSKRIGRDGTNKEDQPTCSGSAAVLGVSLPLPAVSQYPQYCSSRLNRKVQGRAQLQIRIV